MYAAIIQLINNRNVKASTCGADNIFAEMFQVNLKQNFENLHPVISEQLDSESGFNEKK